MPVVDGVYWAISPQFAIPKPGPFGAPDITPSVAEASGTPFVERPGPTGRIPLSGITIPP